VISSSHCHFVTFGRAAGCPSEKLPIVCCQVFERPAKYLGPIRSQILQQTAMSGATRAHTARMPTVRRFCILNEQSATSSTPVNYCAIEVAPNSWAVGCRLDVEHSMSRLGIHWRQLATLTTGSSDLMLFPQSHGGGGELASRPGLWIYPRLSSPSFVLFLHRALSHAHSNCLR